MGWSQEDRELLSQFVTDLDGNVFAIRNLPEEVVAVLFAYYSRSQTGLRENLLKLLKEDLLGKRIEEKISEEASEKLGVLFARQMEMAFEERARRFHERWVLGYGHSSIAEHSVAHIAVERISILLTKLLEDTRLASYTEKSTRYVIFDVDGFYRPKEIMESGYGPEYEDLMRSLMGFYLESFDPVIEELKRRVRREEGISDIAYESLIRAKACDILRYILPASTLTNVGITINARSLEHMVRKLLSYPLSEAKELGESIKREGMKVIPTLIRYAEENEYMVETERAMNELSKELGIKEVPTTRPSSNSVRLIWWPDDAEERLIASILYQYAHLPFDALLSKAKEMGKEERERVLDEYLKRRGPYDRPLRALEYIYYTFEILLDFGAYRDIQRHRMATQIRQILTPYHGYEIPEEIEEFGLKERYKDLMGRAESFFSKVNPISPYAAQYVLPLAYRVRELVTWNLREIHHFVSLRSRKEGHRSYRKIAQEVYRELERVHPLLARYIRVDMDA